MTTLVIIRLPAEVARRFRSAIPARQRSEFVRKLLEANLPHVDEQTYELAVKAEAFESATIEQVSELDATLMDGLDPNESFDNAKLLALCQK